MSAADLRAEFDALLVGPPTEGGLIRHRRAKPRNVDLLRSRRWHIHLRPGFRLGVAVVPHYPHGVESKPRDGFDAYLWAGRLIVGFHWPRQGIVRARRAVIEQAVQDGFVLAASARVGRVQAISDVIESRL